MGIFIPKTLIDLKLNITWAKCKVARLLSLRQGIWGGGDRTANWNKFMNLLGHQNKSSKLGLFRSNWNIW
jgi:hypothetical protein